MINKKDLKEIFDYDPDTGLFTRLTGRVGGKKGAVAGSINKKGYVCIYVMGKVVKAHRLAWIYCYGYSPDEQIDHINRDKSDNRISNLRLVNNGQNQTNCVTQRNNSSGYKGVSFHKTWKKWQAYIYHEGKRMHLGTFTNPEQASTAYELASYMFHGEFRP